MTKVYSTMSLEPGNYEITSAIDGNPIVARHPIEDHSGNPKTVFALPLGIRPLGPWTVEKASGDKYILKAFGSPTAAIDKKLFAILNDLYPAQEWVVTRIPQAGEDAYTVRKPDSPEGWFTAETDEQIKVQHLIVGPSEPPFHPPGNVFIFKLLLED
ncbi:unnamed protein product [Somion occarium]|uniref:Serine protease inhibitor n=1 Tax=Somion occarium TaxID=3059160 RepID=A0ABP1DHN8_9APHY